VDQTSAVGAKLAGAEPAELSTAARRWRLFLCIAILAAFAVWTSGYVYRHASDFQVLTHLPGWFLLGLFAIAAASVICNGLYIKFALQAFQVELPAREWLSLTVGTSLLNYVTPLRGGMLVRAVYLKAHYQFGYVDFLSTLSAMYLMYIFIYALLGLAGGALLWQHDASTDPIVLALLAAAATASALLMFVPVRLPRGRVFPLRQLAQILDGWTLLRRKRATFRKLMGTTLVFALLSALEVKLAASAVGVELSWAGVLLYSSGQNLAVLASLTPVALGIAEAVSIYLGTTLGYDISQALMIQALLRAVPLALLLLVALPAFHRLGVGTLRRSRAVSPPCDPGEGAVP
jgi:uncharacterized membrane protein YbhN (UPF0104 family)